MTEAEFALLPDDLPSGPVRYELRNGELVILPLNDWNHGTRITRLWYHFRIAADACHARAWARGTLVIRRNPDHLLLPDGYVTTEEQKPLRRSENDFLETPPRIVAELRSTNDSLDELKAKVADYLVAGVIEAWLVDPFRQVVEIHTADGVRSFGPSDTVLSAVLPTFAAHVAELFAE